MKPVNDFSHYLRSEYFTCAEIERLGRTVTHVIRDLCETVLRDGTPKSILRFQDPTALKLVMNQTRLRDTGAKLGYSAGTWTGATVQLSLRRLNSSTQTIVITVLQPPPVIESSFPSDDPYPDRPPEYYDDDEIDF